MIRRTPRSTRTDTLFPYTTLFRSVDILVNNAGCQDRNYLENTTSEFWDQVQNVNVRGPFIAIREAVKVMRADGTKGRIVNIASNSALHPTAKSLLAYSTSKAGIAGLTRAAAMEVVQRSEEHTSELQSLMRISYAVFCLKKKKVRTAQSTT